MYGRFKRKLSSKRDIDYFFQNTRNKQKNQLDPDSLAYLCSLSEGLLKSFGGEGGGFSNNVAYYRERTICMDLEKNSSKIDSELVKSSDDTLLHEL